jgi:hypothetical protein
MAVSLSNGRRYFCFVRNSVWELGNKSMQCFPKLCQLWNYSTELSMISDSLCLNFICNKSALILTENVSEPHFNDN